MSKVETVGTDSDGHSTGSDPDLPGGAEDNPLHQLQTASLTASSAHNRVTDTLLDLQRDAPYALAAITARREPTGRDDVVRSYGMSRAHVQDGIAEFIPRSAYFHEVTSRPQDILDWVAAPDFAETSMARDHLVNAGITQGMSFALMRHDRVVGSFHLNFAGIHEFSDTQFQALDAARSAVTSEVAAFVEAADFGLTRREREVLRLLAHGATNTDIAEAFYISRSTVKAHVEHVLFKLKVSNRVQASRAAFLLGMA